METGYANLSHNLPTKPNQAKLIHFLNPNMKLHALMSSPFANKLNIRFILIYILHLLFPATRFEKFNDFDSAQAQVENTGYGPPQNKAKEGLVTDMSEGTEAKGLGSTRDKRPRDFSQYHRSKNNAMQAGLERKHTAPVIGDDSMQEV